MDATKLRKVTLTLYVCDVEVADATAEIQSAFDHLYVLVGVTVQSDTTKVWMVAAYSNWTMAVQDADMLNRIATDHSYIGLIPWPERKTIRERLEQYDSQVEMGPGGTRYHIQTVPLHTTPMEPEKSDVLL